MGPTRAASRAAAASLILAAVWLRASTLFGRDAPPPLGPPGAPEPGAPPELPAGRFIAEYEEPANPEYGPLWKEFRKDRSLDKLVSFLNDRFTLDSDIVIKTAACGNSDVGALFNRDTSEVVLCYERMLGVLRFYQEAGESDKMLGGKVASAIAFALFHELGHALVHVFSLPVTGSEEDAVDEFASIVLLEAGEGGVKLAEDAVSWPFDRAIKQTRFEVPAYWAEHSVDMQRGYKLACLVYGKDSEGHADYLERNIVPSHRARRCRDQYRSKRNAWYTILAPHMRGYPGLLGPPPTVPPGPPGTDQQAPPPPATLPPPAAPPHAPEPPPASQPSPPSGPQR